MSPMSEDIFISTLIFGSACVTFWVMLDGAGNCPKSLLALLSFQLPLRSGAAAHAKEAAVRARIRSRMRVLDQTAGRNSMPEELHLRFREAFNRHDLDAVV